MVSEFRHRRTRNVSVPFVTQKERKKERKKKKKKERKKKKKKKKTGKGRKVCGELLLKGAATGYILPIGPIVQ